MSIVKRLAINDEGLVFDPATGDSYMVNATAGVLLRGVQEGLEPAALAARLVAHFDVDQERALQDVDDFLLQLRAVNVL